MNDFTIRELKNSNIEQELQNIGFDSSYIHNAVGKFQYKTIKIYDLSVAQANILKQTALSVGCDCATNKNVITGEKELSNVILTSSKNQLKKIIAKLIFQPFGLKKLAQQLENLINTERLPSKTKIMGILNLTTDSFSDGGDFYKYNDAVKQLDKLIEEGADIIDIGAESTRPGADSISAKSQLEKIVPILEYVNKNNISTPISIDTRSSEVAKVCLEYGVEIINDVSGLEYDPQMAEVVAKFQNSKLIIQHSKDSPKTMQESPSYNDLMEEIYFFLENKINIALKKGIKYKNIIIDPGIGFGKTREHNLEILKRWQELKYLNCEILIGTSRKSFLNIPKADNKTKDIYTLCFNTELIRNHVDLIRVHDVKSHRLLIDNVLQGFNI